MIKKIIVENYESHKKTIVNLSPGVNVLIGPSDSGKSGFLRAINWLRKNRPQGCDYLREDTEECSCQIITDDKKSIIRKRNSDFNGYIYFTDIEDNKSRSTFDGLGASVPDKVDKDLNLSDINVQSQFDNHFLLSSDWSTGAIAEYLNTIVDLQIIDESIARVNKKIRNIEKEIKDKEKYVKDITDQIQELSYLDELKERIDKIQELQKEVDKNEDRSQGIQELLSKINNLQLEIDKDKNYKEALENVEALDSSIKSLKSLQERCSNIQFVSDAIKTIQQLIEKQNDYNKALEIASQIEDELKLLEHYEEKYEAVDDLTDKIVSYQASISSLDKEFAILNKDLSKYNYNECPLCGSKINGK